MKTTIFLFTIGILLSAQLLSQSSDSILLTENNTVHFSGKVDEVSVAKAQRELGLLSVKLGKNDIIYLVIDSPGGSVVDGNQFIDFASALPQKIKPICVFCASMGYHMFQSFDERLVMPSSMLMSHRVSIGGLSGQVPGEANSRLKRIERISHEMDVKVAKRIGSTVEAYKALIYDELWLSGAEAVEVKHADRLAKFRCSKGLLTGTKKSSVNTLFGPVDVVMSKCPLISGILSFSFKRESFRSEAEVLTLVKKAKRTSIWNF